MWHTVRPNVLACTAKTQFLRRALLSVDVGIACDWLASVGRFSKHALAVIMVTISTVHIINMYAVHLHQYTL